MAENTIFSLSLLDKTVNLRRENYYLVYIRGFLSRMSHIWKKSKFIIWVPSHFKRTKSSESTELI